jgi:predicted nucleic acid-binding protein
MTDRIFVDSNIWVCAVDTADPSKQERARAVVEPRAGVDIVISSQVLTEFYAVVTRKLAVPLPETQAFEMVTRLSELPVIPIDVALVASAIAGSREWRVSLWDALIIRAAEVAGCEVLLSEDLAAGTRYGAVTVSNPLA